MHHLALEALEANDVVLKPSSSMPDSAWQVPSGGPGTSSGGSWVAVQQAAVVNMDETGWRQEQQRAWLWTVVTSGLTVFQIDRSRGGAVVEALLGSALTGAVGSD